MELGDVGLVDKPTLHLPYVFHVMPNMETHSHCAFGAKCFKFSKMMQAHGWHVIEYANHPSLSACADKEPMLSLDELEALAGKQKRTDFHGNLAVWGTPWWAEFDKRLRAALKRRVKKGDIILHPFGRAHQNLVKDFPEQQHVESGIGYPDEEFGAHRIFESNYWRAWHEGRTLNYDVNGRVQMKDNLPVVGRNGRDYEWTAPNYFDPDDWPVSTAPGSYVLFFGRICQVKGMDIVKAIAEAGVKVKVAGQGDMAPWAHPNLEYLGPVTGKARGYLLANASCMICPSRFTEPFAGVAVEAQMCGTPAIGPSFGAFCETIEHGITGFRCHTLGDWLSAIERSPKLNRVYIAAHARRLYSLESVGLIYDRIFTQMHRLNGEGWYDRRAIWTG